MKRRAATLPMILASSALLLLLALVFASASLSSLQLAHAFHENSRTEQLARAAVTRFMLEAERVPVNPLGPTSPDWWRSLSGQPLLPPGLGGQVWLHFDQRRPYFSVDNSSSETPAPGWPDQGTAARSVPPYCYGLILEVGLDGRSARTYYEALVQRRWLYAVATGGGLVLRGAPSASSGLVDFVGASSIEGSAYLLPMEASRALDDSAAISVAPEVYAQVSSGAATMDAFGPVSIGGQVILPDLSTSAAASRENRISGRIDFSEEGQPRVAPGNSIGGAREHISSASLSRFQSLLEVPNLLGPRNPFPHVRQTLGGYEPGPDGWVRRILDVALLDQNYALGDRPADWPSDPGYIHVPGSSFSVGHPVANHYVETTADEQGTKEYLFRYPTRLTLTNCSLYVKGFLDLSGSATSLSGENSTLVVDGTLVLNGGNLDALESGMVISCRRLLARCSGEYRGLILVSESAVLVPPAADEEGLTIHGGLVCGGAPVVVRYDALMGRPQGQPLEPPTAPPDHQTRRQVSGLTLYNTRVIYEPRYLKHLNPAGNCQVLGLRRL